MSAFKTNDELIAEHVALIKGLRNPTEAMLPDGRTVAQASADFQAAEAANAEELRLQRVAVREAREQAEQEAKKAEVASSTGSAASATEDKASAKQQPK